MFRLSTDCQTAHSPPPTATPPTRPPASFFLALCYHFHFKMSLSWQRLLLLERSASFSQPHPQPHLRLRLRLWPLNASPTPCYSGPFCAGPKRRDVTTPLQPVRSPCPPSLLRSCLFAVSSCFKTFRGLWPLYKCFCNGFCKVNFFAFVVFSFSLSLCLTLCLTWPASDCECVTFVQGRSVECVEGGGVANILKCKPNSYYEDSTKLDTGRGQGIGVRERGRGGGGPSQVLAHTCAQFPSPFSAISQCLHE